MSEYVFGDTSLMMRFNALKDAVRLVLDAAAMSGAELTRDLAEQKAPGPGIVAELVDVGSTFAEAVVGPDKEHWYYQFFETGVQAHDITGDPLAFEGQSGVIFTRRVMHPGFEARPFLRPVMDEHEDDVAEKMARVFKAAILEAVG